MKKGIINAICIIIILALAIFFQANILNRSISSPTSKDGKDSCASFVEIDGQVVSAIYQYPSDSMSFKVFEFRGHRYIEKIGAGIEHDPECPCMGEQK